MARTRNPWLGPAARPVALPEDVDDPPAGEGDWERRTSLPHSVERAIPDVRPLPAFASRSHRVRVYEQVLREGTEDDIRFYEVVLPPNVRRAWAD